MNTPKSIVVLVSGTGTNLMHIAEYFEGRTDVSIISVMSNKADAPALEWAKSRSLDVFTFSGDDLNKKGVVLAELQKLEPDLIVLAGFSKLIPSEIVKAYPNKIINIHPALLPKYGGKGMYGMHVHEAIIQNKDEYSGITIHFVNEAYDEGQIIFQTEIDLSENETPESLANKIHALEYENYPRVIDKLLSKVEQAE